MENFIEQLIKEELASKKCTHVQTRFPPEPNGYLHIGHAKSICLNFGLASAFNGKCNLRFDDTNPETEDKEYIESIQRDIKWLGYDWEDRLFYASDYFDQLYEMATKLIKKGKAYVDDLPADIFNELKGTPTVAGKESPFRNRSIEDNLTIFRKMKMGDFKEGECVLRAKIDMTSPNMHMRDPIIYRIKHITHYRTASKWCIYPTYDFAHGQSDSIENITHSLCTLEFEVHRPLYEWLIKTLEIYPSRQMEFASLNLSYTVLSKRKLKELVEQKYVNGWDDPRVPTLSGMKRRGFTPDGIKIFINKIGVARREGLSDMALLEHSIREDLNKKSNRVFGILNPVKLIITNLEENHEESLLAINNPEDKTKGTRTLSFSKYIYIDRDDFKENPPSPRKWYRLGPNREVRLKYAYIIKCTGYEKDSQGNLSVIYAEYDPKSKSGQDTSGKKVKGTLGWVSVNHAIPAEIRFYDRLFITENMNEVSDDFKNHINPQSLKINKKVVVEESLKNVNIGDQVQFERIGYFRVDEDTTKKHLVFNRTLSIKDNWSKKFNV